MRGDFKSKYIKCNDFDITFQTNSGLKVHIDLIHGNESVNQDELKCNHCLIKCSDLTVLTKHMKRDQKFKCKKMSSNI